MLPAALQTEKVREEFLEDLQNTLQREKGNTKQHSEERAPDNHWSAWMTTLQSVALRHFSRDKRTECRSDGDGGGTRALMALGPQQVLEFGSWDWC